MFLGYDWQPVAAVVDGLPKGLHEAMLKPLRED